jgi:hypothetical protein
VPPFRNASAGDGLVTFIPCVALLIFLAGAPFITVTPRQGALGGLTPLENEPAACGCDVQNGDGYQGEDHDFVELAADPRLEASGRILSPVNWGQSFVVKCRKHRRPPALFAPSPNRRYFRLNELFNPVQ